MRDGLAAGLGQCRVPPLVVFREGSYQLSVRVWITVHRGWVICTLIDPTLLPPSIHEGRMALMAWLDSIMRYALSLILILP